MAFYRYSASQISTFKGCRRKWHFNSVQGIKAEPTASQQLGKDIHAQIEAFIKSRTPPTDRRAWAGLATMGYDAADVLSTEALGEPGVHVEGEINIPLSNAADGTPRGFLGFIDHLDIRNPALPIVTDHKTTSDLKYAKTSQELEHDTQMLVYGWWVINQHPNATHVKLQHNAIPTRGGTSAVLTHAVVTREHITKKWGEALAVMAEMDTYQTKEVGDVPADGMKNGECERWGGCTYRAACMSAMFSSSPQKEEKEMTTIAEKIQKRRDQGKGSITPEPTAATPAADTDVESRLNALRKDMAPATKPKLAALEVAPEPTSTTPADPNSKSPLERLRAAKQGLAPTPAEERVVDSKSPLERLRAAKQGLAPTPAEERVVEIVMPEVKVETAEVKRTEVKRPSVAARPLGCSYLFLNCAPTQGLEATTLEAFAAPLLETIKQETGKSWQFHDFRNGPGLIVEGLGRADLPSAIIVDTKTPLGAIALEALLPRATIVIRGAS